MLACQIKYKKPSLFGKYRSFPIISHFLHRYPIWSPCLLKVSQTTEPMQSNRVDRPSFWCPTLRVPPRVYTSLQVYHFDFPFRDWLTFFALWFISFPQIANLQNVSRRNVIVKVPLWKRLDYVHQLVEQFKILLII